MNEDDHVLRTMTVARIFEPGAGGQVEVVFLESAMFYRVPGSHPDLAAIVEALHKAQENGTPVEVRLRALDSDLIEGVRLKS